MKKQQIKSYPITGACKPGRLYLAVNALLPGGGRLPVEKMENIFKKRFGYNPAAVFYGKPNGSLIYAGPVIEQGN